MSSAFGVDFGQKVDLTASIRNILRNYPEGTAVLKELVQNADDAGASTVVFYLDYRNHSSAKLADQALEAFQGPSLLVYNDAVFTAEDFNSIQRIGDSLKKSSEDSRAKIGRFGIGFNAVYHWTDLPSFISSNYLVMLDPQARFLPNVNPSNPGKMIDWIATPNIVKQFPDQFKPYEIDGLSWAKPFKGTLFRLPLRTTEQAKSSLLSKRALPVTDAAALLDALRVEASAMLLFLKSVTKIEIREWKAPSLPAAPSSSTLVFSCHVNNSSAEMMRKRCLVSDKIQLQVLAGNSSSAIAADYTLNIHCTTTSTTYVEHWEVCNQLGGRSANLIASEPENALLRLIPWAGVAACVSVTTSGGSAPTSGDASVVNSATIRDGLAYCFLPLPVRTGLPIMVNGFFELSSNRRDVWQAGADMTGDGRTRALWNLSLMRDLIAPCYSRMLLRLRDILGFSTQYQALWPNLRTTSTPWDEVVRATLHLSKDLRLLEVVTIADFTSVEEKEEESGAKVDVSGNGVSSANGKGKLGMVFAGFGRKTKSTTAGASSGGASSVALSATWISCSAAVLLPLGINTTATSTTVHTAVTTSATSSHTTEGDELTSYLVRAQASLVLTSETLKITLLETQTCTITATPEYVRSILRTSSGSTTVTSANKSALHVPLPYMCKFLLKYCLSDVLITKQLTSATATALHNLPLLPLSSSSVATLCIYTEAQVAAISEVCSMGFSLSQTVYALNNNKFDILSACDALANTSSTTATINATSSILLLLDEPQLRVFHLAAPALLNRNYIAPNEIDALTHPTIQKYSNVRTFNAQFIPDLLRYILPPACFNGAHTTQSQLLPLQYTTLVEFLGVFWAYASTRADVISSIKEGAHIVPAAGLNTFYPLSRLSNLLVKSKGDVTLGSDIVDILSALGVQFVDTLALPEGASMPAVFWEYVLSPSRSGVLTALDFLLRNGTTSSGTTSVFERLTAQQRDALRLYIATAEPIKHLTEKECAIVRNLPIFASCQDSSNGDGDGVDGSSHNGVSVSSYVSIGDRIARNTNTANSKSNRTPYATVVDYTHLPPTILPSHLLRHVSAPDLQLLTHLQVTVLSRAQYFRTEFLPSVQYLYHLHPAQCVQAVLCMCDEVKVLCESDKDFLNLLRSAAFIPCATSIEHIASSASNSTDTSTANTPSHPNTISSTNTTAITTNTSTNSATRLRRACELFDPSDHELTSLLDIQCFPHTLLIPVLHRPELLVLLKSVGLQTSLNWPAIVACARSIADMRDTVPTTNTDTTADSTTTTATTVVVNSRKTDRGRSLLRFLDKNMTRLSREETDRHAVKKSSGASSSQQSAGNNVFSFSFSTLFGGSSKDTHTTNTANTTSASSNNTTFTTHATNTTGAVEPMEVYVEQLRLISWVPVATESLHVCMPWPTASITSNTATNTFNTLPLTAAPVDTYPVHDAWLVSATRRLVSDTVHTPALQRLLGWNDPVHVSVIAVQLRELSRLYLKLYGAGSTNSISAASTDNSGNGDANTVSAVEVQRLRETITGLIPQLYQRLNAAASNSTTGNSTVDILRILESAAWIWVGNTFVPIDKVALNAGVNAAPFLYQLPQDLQVYSALLVLFQVKSRFSNRDYVEALTQMAVESGAVNTTKSTSGGTNASTARSLSDTHLDICISLVTLLSTESTTSSTPIHTTHTIYLPDTNGRLTLSSQLTNDDVPWLSGPEYISVRSGCRLIHPNISSHVATTLGVQSLRLSLLNQNLDQNIFNASSIESFGQAESLTNRLKTILDMYPDGNPIFSELIQNADDAGATVVSILLDENTYQSESLLDTKMSALQGPALIVRNNAVFSESDFASLAKIGQGSKLDKLDTTGRFGLGFNSTYHITDTPSFVSGDHVVIFDPHCHYVPGATNAQPGVRIRYANTTLHTTFKNQFEPFTFFGCDVNSHYNGTLFRFPLRTPSQARKSEISKRSYSIADVEANLTQLNHNLSNMLIFLRNVRCIEVYRCVQGTHVPVLLHKASSTVSGIEHVHDQYLLSYFDRNYTASGGALSRDGFYKRLLSTPDNVLPKVFSQVSVESEVYAESSGGNSSISGLSVENNTDDTAVTTTNSTPNSSITARSTVTYLVCAGLCGGDAKRMACIESLRHFKLVPMGAVAACVSRSGDINTTTTNITSASNSTTLATGDTQYPALQGVAFCYLPLPVLTQLPVHVNAYFELSSNRRDIWKGDDTKGEAKMRSDWNICIMRDVLAPLYSALLAKLHARAQLAALRSTGGAGSSDLSIRQLHQRQQQLHQKLLSLLPCPTPHAPWNTISDALCVHLKNANLFYSELGGGSFVPLKDAYLIENYGVNSTNSADILQQKLEQLLLLENIPVVRTPTTVLTTLLQNNVVAGSVCPALVRRMFNIIHAHKHATLGVTGSGSSFKAHSHVLSVDNLDNAVFWLQYAFKDITHTSSNSNNSGDGASGIYQELIGLNLLPLENNTLGTLQNVTDAAPYFTVSDTERRLLGRAGGSIIAAESVLGAQVYGVLKSELFTQLNVRAITSVDTLKLITTILPPHWMASDTVCASRSTTSANNTTAVVSKEWLFSLWSYIIENKCIDMYTDMFPIMPIVYPKVLPEGEYVVKVSRHDPVLHMTYREIKSDVVSVLALLGVFISDPSVLEGKSYSAEVVQLLSPPTARGVLDALVLRVQALQADKVDLTALIVNNCMPKSVRETMLCNNKLYTNKSNGSGSAGAAQFATQCFVLDSVIAKIDALTSTDIEVLCAVPIWCTYKVNTTSNTTSTDPATLTYSALDLLAMKLPPVGTTTDHAHLLDHSFLRTRNELDRALYAKLGVAEPSMGVFYSAHVVSKLQNNLIHDKHVDALAVSVLRSLSQLEKESPGLTQSLSSCAFIRSDGSNPTLYAPVSLYDPQAPLLSTFMPSGMFPSGVVFSDVSLLSSLRLLGLQNKVSPQGIISAAKAIQRDFEQCITAKRTTAESAEVAEKINMRAMGLMSYLEAHIEEILQVISPASIHDCTHENELNAQGGERISALPRAPVPPAQLYGGAWGAELRSITWVPVFTTAPTKVVHADLALPWPTRTHNASIAAPSQCNSLSNIWLCSSSHRICSIDTQSELLLYVLGWDKPIPGRSIAGQLLALRQTHDAAVEKMHFSQHSANEIFTTVVPNLLSQLQLAYQRESPAEITLWVDALRGKAIIWMQSKFIETTRLAFNSMTHLDLEPFLFIVRPEMHRFKALLLELGAREAFEASDLAVLTRDLYASHRDTPLSTYQLTLCVGIVQILHKMISGEEISVDSESTGGVDAEFEAQHAELSAGLPVAEMVSSDANANNSASAVTDASIEVRNTPRAAISPRPAATKKVPAKKVLLNELGVVYLPDARSIMLPSTVLTVDDAPWMSAALHEASAQGGGAFRFVNPRVEINVAVSLGCKSLREQLFTGEDVHCPDVDTLRSTLDEDSLRDTLIDLVYVSDAVGSRSLHLFYDDRTHPSESLLHPGLAETQGPALVAYLEGGEHINREVMAMLLSLQSMSTDLFKGAEDHHSTPLHSPQAVVMNSARSKFRRSTGKKLLTTFAVTDCLQVLSGNEFYVFDPCGKYLLSSTDGASSKQSSTADALGGKRLQSKLSRKSVTQGTERAKATPRAQHYVINKNAQRGGASNSNGNTQDALERFPDQFASFLSLPFSFREQLQRQGRINGIVVRLPLRREASAISNTLTSVNEIKAQLGGLRSFVAPALVFAEHLVEVRVSHWDVHGSGDNGTFATPISGVKSGATNPPTTNTSGELNFDLSIKLLTPSSNRKSRYNLVADKGWQKQGFTKFFAKPFVPPEIIYAVIIVTSVTCDNMWIQPSPQVTSLLSQLQSTPNTTVSGNASIHTHSEDWLVAATHGYGRLRDVALSEPYATMEMQPFVTIAAPILDNAQLTDISTPPDAGLYFSSGAAAGLTGLPFHVEGSFFQPHNQSVVDKSVRFASENRGVSMPVAAKPVVTFSRDDISAASQWTEALLFVAIETLYPKVLFEIKARIESVAKSATTTVVTGANSSANKLRHLSGFYKYLPYTPRLTAVASRVLHTTTLTSGLVQHPLFLQQNGFFYLHESLLPVSVLPQAVSAYILPILPLAHCPLQLAVDLKAAKMANVPALTSAKLRSTMANNALMHCSRLTNNASLVTALLDFVLEDIVDKSKNEGEFTRRKLFREMSGVPLMPMANLNVKTFPRSAAEQVAIAPLILHALLPGLRNSFLHPTLTTKIPLFSDPLFMETLFISKFNAAYLEYNIGSIVPSRWRHAPAVQWEGSSATVSVGSQNRVVRGAEAAAMSAPSPLLVYILWNSFLSAEPDWNQIERLREYPLIPVVSKNRRLLLSMSLLSVVFSDISTEQQDTARTHLKREIGRLTALANTSAALPDATNSTEQLTDEWAWTSQPATVGARNKHLPGQASGSVSAGLSVGPNNRGGESDDDIGDGVITDLDFTDSVLPPAVVSVGPLSPLTSGLVPTAVATEFNAEDQNDMSQAVVDGRIHLSEDLLMPPAPPRGPDSANIRRILTSLGVPFLDTGIYEDIPVVIRGHRSTGEGGASDLGGRRILQCLHKLDSLHITIQPSEVLTVSEIGNESVELLCYDELTVPDRNALLLLLGTQQHQGMAPLTTAEQTQLKQLRLFTSKIDNAAVSIAECKGGVYWCREEAVLDTIANRNAHGPQSALAQAAVPVEAPIVLIYDPSLLVLYTLLNIEELTAATAVRKFTVPHLRTMAPLARLKVMLNLASQWGSYRSDEALVTQLKDLPFIPPYSQSSQLITAHATPIVGSAPTNWNSIESCETVDVSTLRTAKDVFLWTNDELLDALKGPMQSEYFPPPYLRTAEMHVMCQDLGMQNELTEATFKRILTDIETSVSEGYANNHDSTGTSHLLREAADRGRNILRYVKTNDRISTLLQNRTFATSVGKIKFVPMRVPVSTEAGGYVTYREDVGRFDMLLARTHGTLAFTVMPIIDEDITPPQFYFSALGITGTPGADVVLRHIRNLTSQGDSLDRWNAPYAITATFNAIFQFLSDNWKTLSPNVKSSLSGINLVPVGHSLIKPTRLFFRLAEDLSPFMHEIPRLYGAHEAFLKQIGIKESPTVAEYVRFLSDLATECGDCYLNPNELRAVVAILQVIATQSSDSAENTPLESGTPADSGKLTTVEFRSASKTAELSMLYVPDERSVMRQISQCLVNDNEWYRGNPTVLHHLHSAGLYLLHPSITNNVAELLSVDALTSVVSERLDLSHQHSDVSDATQFELQRKYQAIMTDQSFIKALSTLVVNKDQNKNNDLVDASNVNPRTSAALTAVMHSIKFVFVNHISTKFLLTYTTTRGNESVVEFADQNSRERLCFLDKTTSESELYINLQMASTQPLTLNLAVAAGLCQKIRADLSLCYAIAALMESQGALHLQTVLESLQVHMDASDEFSSESNQHRGVPGERVTAEDLLLLELRPFRVYRIGEIVAYEVTETSTEKEVVTKMSGSSKDKLYAKIISMGTASDEGIRRLNVKIGSSVVSVLSTDIFSFKSAREINVSRAASGGLRVPSVAALKRTVFGGPKPAPAPSSTLYGKPSTEDSGEVSTASRNELLGAVNGLLVRAGVPIDLEQQDMIAHILELENAKKRMEKELLAERQQLLQSKEQLEASSNRLKCSICCTHDVYYVLVPCGHTTCEQCTDAWNRPGCPICRTRMQSKVRFFLPGAEA